MDLYLFGLVIAGAPAFGIKAILLGKGRSVSSYGEKSLLIRDVLAMGLLISGISLLFSALFSLKPLFLCLFILVLTTVLGYLFSLKSSDKDKKLSSRKKELSEGEIKSIIEDKGLDNLIDKDEG